MSRIPSLGILVGSLVGILVGSLTGSLAGSVPVGLTGRLTGILTGNLPVGLLRLLVFLSDIQKVEIHQACVKKSFRSRWSSFSPHENVSQFASWSSVRTVRSHFLKSSSSVIYILRLRKTLRTSSTSCFGMVMVPGLASTFKAASSKRCASFPKSVGMFLIGLAIMLFFWGGAYAPYRGKGNDFFWIVQGTWRLEGVFCRKFLYLCCYPESWLLCQPLA